MGSQRVGNDWTIELNWTEWFCHALTWISHVYTCVLYFKKYFSLYRELLFTVLTTSLCNIYSVNYINHIVPYIPSTDLSHNWKFVPFDHLYTLSPSPPLPTSNNYKSVLFFYTFLWGFFWSIIAYKTMQVLGAQHLIILHFTKSSPQKV